LTWVIPPYPLRDHQRGESQLITQLPFHCSLFFWLYDFLMSSTYNYPTSPSNKLSSLFSWLYTFPIYFATNNYPISPSNNFVFVFCNLLYPFPMSIINNYFTYPYNNYPTSSPNKFISYFLGYTFFPCLL